MFNRIIFAAGLTLACLSASVSTLHASVSGGQNVVTAVNASGDRNLMSLGFVGSSTTFNSSNIATFTDGKLMYGSSSFGWNDLAPRDMGTGQNQYPANPDRADVSTPFAAEGSSRGKLSEVFGVNNLSHIIDGEDDGSWKLDLFFPSGQRLFSDGHTGTPELAILERGGNSDLGVKGILFDGSNYSYTSGIVLSRTQFTPAGWTLNTLEISDNQPVVSLGLDLTELGGITAGIVGVRLYSEPSFNGPDIVSVLTAHTVPEPGTMGLLAIAAFGLWHRRRFA